MQLWQVSAIAHKPVQRNRAVKKNLQITFDKLAVEVLSTYLIDDSPVYQAVSVHLCWVICWAKLLALFDDQYTMAKFSKSGVWDSLPSVLWRCWLGGKKGIRPVKNEWCGTGMVICLERDADLHMAQLMPLPLTVSCFNKIQIGFTFLVPAHPGSPGKRTVKRVCVCAVFGAKFQWEMPLF